MHHHSRGLALLLSLGGLPLACTPKDDADTDPDTATGTTTPGMGTSTTAGTSATTGTTATDPTTGNSGTGDTGGTTGQADTSTSQPTSETGPPPATDPICIAYGNHYEECFPPGQGIYGDVLARNCESLKAYGAADGPACIEALDAFFVCFTNLDCAELVNQEGCGEEEQAALAACPSIGGETTGGGSSSSGG